MTHPPAAPGSRGLWAGLALGLPVMAYGGAGVVADAAQTHPPALAAWIVGAAAVHDLVLAPLALAGSWAVARLSRGSPLRWLRWAAATTAVLALFAWPLVRGYGRRAGVPSLLPRDYTTGLLAYVAAVWAAAVAAALVSRRSGARSDRRPHGPRGRSRW